MNIDSRSPFVVGPTLNEDDSVLQQSNERAAPALPTIASERSEVAELPNVSPKPPSGINKTYSTRRSAWASKAFETMPTVRDQMQQKESFKPRMSLFSRGSAYPQQDAKKAERVERILSPGIARALEDKTILRTQMTKQKSPIASLNNADGTHPQNVDELIGSTVRPADIVSGETLKSPFADLTNEKTPLMPPHKGGEGIRKLVRARENNKSLLGFGTSYDYWDISLFALKGRAWPLLPQLVYLVYSTIVVALVVQFVDNYEEKREFHYGMHHLIGTMGTALFFLLAFRTNSSYERWWEGRKHWDQVVVKVDDMCRISLSWIAERDPRCALDLIRWSLAMIYLIKNELRTEIEHPELVGILSDDEIHELEWSLHHPIVQCSQTLSSLVVKANKSTTALGMPNAIISILENSISGLIAASAACQRIASTPMPWAYICHLRSFMVLWLLGLPFAFVYALGYWTILICAAVGYQLLGFESISVEVENPFGTDYNDLPLDSMALEVFAKCRAAMLELGFDVDLDCRVKADPLFAHCYYAETHKSLFKPSVPTPQPTPKDEVRISVQNSKYWAENGEEEMRDKAAGFEESPFA